MTGVKLSTGARLGLNPIVIVLNNDGYGTMRKIRAGWFNVITQWDYPKICRMIRGGQSATATTTGEFDAALSRAEASSELLVIEARAPREDTSSQLTRIAHEVARRRGWAKKQRKQLSAVPNARNPVVATAAALGWLRYFPAKKCCWKERSP